MDLLANARCVGAVELTPSSCVHFEEDPLVLIVNKLERIVELMEESSQQEKRNSERCGEIELVIRIAFPLGKKRHKFVLRLGLPQSQSPSRY